MERVWNGHVVFYCGDYVHHGVDLVFNRRGEFAANQKGSHPAWLRRRGLHAERLEGLEVEGMNDYIELGPDDVIRGGDESRPKGIDLDWCECKYNGVLVSELPSYEFRRPRLTLIRDAAIELLRDAYSGTFCSMSTFNVDLKNLREAIGISIEDLRKGGDE